MRNLQTVQNDMLEILLSGDTNRALSLASEVLDQGTSPITFFEECIAPSLAEIGKRFETLEIFLPEMVFAAEIVNQMNEEVISPAIETSHSEKIASMGRVLLATVKGDMHDIGKNMVALMLRVNGFEVVDLGTDVPPIDIVLAAEKEKVDIIGLSSLLTTCLPYMKDVVDYLEAGGTRPKYSVIIGGAAATEEFAKSLKADGIGKSAAEAVSICREIMKG